MNKQLRKKTMSRMLGKNLYSRRTLSIIAMLPPVDSDDSSESDNEEVIISGCDPNLNNDQENLDGTDFISQGNTSQSIIEYEDEDSCNLRRSQRFEIVDKHAQSDSTSDNPVLQTRVKKIIKRENMKFNFCNEEFEYPVNVPEKVFDDIPIEVQSPLTYFQHFLKDNFIQEITDNTNLYSTQRTGKSVGTNLQEMRSFIGIELFMGIINMPSYCDFWSQSFRYEQIASVMPLKRYQALRRNIHFANNEEDNGTDRYFKVRPLLDHVRNNCLNIEEENRFSIDEMMVPYKGTRAGSRRQYLRNKPKKWGFKFFVRCGVSGMVYDFIPYGGENTFINHDFSEQEQRYFGIGGKVVVALCKSIHNKPLKVVYFDNWFSSLELLVYLRVQFGILSLGTILKNRLRGCDLVSDKILLKRGRGSSVQVCDNKKKISITKWADNKCVQVVSSYSSTRDESQIKRYCKEQKTKVNVKCPQVILDYNKHMGGVDLADMLIALYRTGLKTHRWYIKIFGQMLDICINNGWLLYKRHCNILGIKKPIPLKKFRHEVIRGLLTTNIPRIGRPAAIPSPSHVIRNPVVARPTDETRMDNVDHFPRTVTKGRCRLCTKGQTIYCCLKCNLRLCILPDRNCFLSYHKTK